MGKRPIAGNHNIVVSGKNNTVSVIRVSGNHNTVSVIRDPSGDSWARYNDPGVKLRRRIVLTLIALVFALIAAPLIPLVVWQWLLGAVVIAGVASAVYVVLKDFRDEDREIAARKRAIAARADAQHQAILEGDERTGTYGNYPPAL